MESRFIRTFTPPQWEGITFIGLKRDDERFPIFEASPRDELRSFIANTWFMPWQIPPETEVDGIIVPIPCVKLCLIHSPQSRKTHSLLIGPKTKGVLSKMSGHGAMIGIDFQPGAFFALTGIDLGKWKNQQLDASMEWPELPAPPPPPWNPLSMHKWFESVEKLLVEKSRTFESHHFTRISRLIQSIRESEDALDVESLCETVGISKRTLQRVLPSEVGLSPRDLLRVVRFQKAIQSMNGSKLENLAAFANESGFFDQPHMNKEFQKLVQANPALFKKFY
jgi:AraC-like DNA-binding protein